MYAWGGYIILPSSFPEGKILDQIFFFFFFFSKKFLIKILKHDDYIYYIFACFPTLKCVSIFYGGGSSLLPKFAPLALETFLETSLSTNKIYMFSISYAHKNYFPLNALLIFNFYFYSFFFFFCTWRFLLFKVNAPVVDHLKDFL